MIESRQYRLTTPSHDGTRQCETELMPFADVVAELDRWRLARVREGLSRTGWVITEVRTVITQRTWDRWDYYRGDEGDQ